MPKKKNRPSRDVKPVLHIYCEGEKTEPNYFNGYINKFFPTNRRLKVIKVEATKKNTPKQLVDVAVAAKKNSLDDDVFWVVYDRESEQKYADQHHAVAYDKAQKIPFFLLFLMSVLRHGCFYIFKILTHHTAVTTI